MEIMACHGNAVQAWQVAEIVQIGRQSECEERRSEVQERRQELGGGGDGGGEPLPHCLTLPISFSCLFGRFISLPLHSSISPPPPSWMRLAITRNRIFSFHFHHA